MCTRRDINFIYTEWHVYHLAEGSKSRVSDLPCTALENRAVKDEMITRCNTIWRRRQRRRLFSHNSHLPPDSASYIVLENITPPHHIQNLDFCAAYRFHAPSPQMPTTPMRNPRPLTSARTPCTLLSLLISISTFSPLTVPSSSSSTMTNDLDVLLALRNLGNLSNRL
jgi:hypothetical protein